MFNFPQLAGRGVERRGLHVAMAEGPDLRADAFPADKRIVFRDGAVGIDSHDLAQQAIEPLRLHPSLGNRSLAESDEQRAITAEDQPSAEVQR